MKSRSVTFTDEEDRFFTEYAKRKAGWSLQTFIKTALYFYADRYPKKDIVPIEDPSDSSAVTQSTSQANIQENMERR